METWVLVSHVANTHNKVQRMSRQMTARLKTVTQRAATDKIMYEENKYIVRLSLPFSTKAPDSRKPPPRGLNGYAWDQYAIKTENLKVRERFANFMDHRVSVWSVRSYELKNRTQLEIKYLHQVIQLRYQGRSFGKSIGATFAMIGQKVYFRKPEGPDLFCLDLDELSDMGFSEDLVKQVSNSLFSSDDINIDLQTGAIWQFHEGQFYRNGKKMTKLSASIRGPWVDARLFTDKHYGLTVSDETDENLHFKHPFSSSFLYVYSHATRKQLIFHRFPEPVYAGHRLNTARLEGGQDLLVCAAGCRLYLWLLQAAAASLLQVIEPSLWMVDPSAGLSLCDIRIANADFGVEVLLEVIWRPAKVQEAGPDREQRVAKNGSEDDMCVLFD